MKSKIPAKDKKRTITETFTSQNIPQTENLLTEPEYGEAIAPYFDELFPPKIMDNVHKPFYNMLVKKYAIQSACDISCRTGQTLKLLSTLGVKKLAGMDINAEMIGAGKKKLPKVEFATAPLNEASQAVSGKFDLVLCSKDSLPLVLDDESLLNIFVQTKDLLNDTGILIVEVLNYAKIWKNKERFMPVMDRSDGKSSKFFFYLNDFHEELLVRNLIRFAHNKHEWFAKIFSIPIRPLMQAELEFFVKEAHFSKYGFFGSYTGRPYSAEESPYTILIAKK